VRADFGETGVASDSDRSEAQGPDASASPPIASEARTRNAAAADAAIGYEAADPSLQMPLWRETLDGNASQRDR